MSATLRIARAGAGPAARVFGIDPATRLERQLTRLKIAGERVLMIGEDVVVDTPALAHLTGGEPLVIIDTEGRPLVAWVEAGRAEALRDDFTAGRTPASDRTAVAGSFDFAAGALKKREVFHAFALDRTPVRTAENAFYFASYKGVTDIVTKYAWPWPALLVVRACAALGISPNMVTSVSILLSILAIPLFMQGQFAAGLACAWGMTFLDTVDGKLARVTVSYSKFGNLFDHIPDIVFPPVWWWAFAWGATIGVDAETSRLIWLCFAAVMASYLVGRLCEGAFEVRNGFGPFVWRPFDATFRLILARRNPNLLILTAAVIAGAPVAGYQVLAAWCVACAAVQLVRFVQSELERRRGTLTSFLQGEGETMRPANPLGEMLPQRSQRT